MGTKGAAQATQAGPRPGLPAVPAVWSPGQRGQPKADSLYRYCLSPACSSRPKSQKRYTFFSIPSCFAYTMNFVALSLPSRRQIFAEEIHTLIFPFWSPSRSQEAPPKRKNRTPPRLRIRGGSFTFVRGFASSFRGRGGGAVPMITSSAAYVWVGVDVA